MSQLQSFIRKPLTVVVFLLGVPAGVAAQLGEGVSLGVSPTAERTFWNDGLTLSDSWYYGGRVSLNFGRFVALEGYFQQGDDPQAGDFGDLDETYRFGGDVVFSFADRRLSPFLRAGAGITRFSLSPGDENELLTGVGAAGIRFDLFDRFQTNVFAQDVVFRATGASPLVAAGTVPDEETKTFHNLVLGTGMTFYLGGQQRQPETDRVFEGGLRGVVAPLELYAGEIQWDNSLGIEGLPVGGARFGVDFGPYVGLRAFYFGSLEEDQGGFTDYFGYGLEGQFNLSRSDDAFTPFLLLGGGRVHFPSPVAASAGFEDNDKWNAVLGAGLGLNVTERVRVDVSARDYLLALSNPDDVTAPDQLQHSWMFTGGIRFAVFGETREPTPRPTPGGPPPVGPPVATADETEPSDEEATAPATEAAPDSLAREQVLAANDTAEVGDPDPTGLARELASLRAEVDSLRNQLRRGMFAGPSADSLAVRTEETRSAGSPRAGTPATFELPVLPSGEIYIRFGESGTFDRITTAPDPTEVSADDASAPAAATAPSPETAAPPTTSGAAPGSVLEDPQVDSLRVLTGVLQAQLDSLRALRDSEVATEQQEAESDAQRLQEIEARLEELIEAQNEVRVAPEGPGPTVRVEQEPPATQIVTAEDPLIEELMPYAGASFADDNQLVLGVRGDMGDLYESGLHLVPELAFGVTGDFSVTANLHVEWPTPFRIEEAQPFLGFGAGILSDGGTEFLFPSIEVGATYPVRDWDIFAMVQGPDFFESTRVVLGVHTSPPSFLGSSGESRTARAEGSLAGTEPPPALTPADSARIAELARRDAELQQLQQEVDELRREREARQEAAEEAMRVAEEAREAAAEIQDRVDAATSREGPETGESALLTELNSLEDVVGVTEVRETDSGPAVILGGSEAFASGQTDLSEGARMAIRRLADLLVARRQIRVTIEGHTDSRGSEELNQRLSLQRAQAVEQALRAFGVDPARMTAVGLGESQPIADNGTAAGRARNRRVQLFLQLPSPS